MLIAALAGSLIGALAGLIPAIGTFVSLLLAYPWLVEMSVPEIIAFFVCLSSVSQFTGSVPALMLKIPGESSSIIAIKESTEIQQRGELGDAIALTAVGSFLAGLGAALFTIVFIGVLDGVSLLAFSNTFLTVILIGLVVLFCLNNENPVSHNILMIALGLLLGFVGFNSTFNTNFASFGISELQTGLPLYPVITGLFVVNELSKSNFNVSPPEFKFTTSLQRFHWGSWLRGTVLGYLCGFLPMAGKIIGTTTGYAWERALKTTSLRRLLNAESANNSAIISSLLPLLLFGIPITLGEALIFDIVELKDFTFTINTSEQLFRDILPSIILANFIGLIIAWPLAKQSLIIFKLNSTAIFIFIGIVLVFTNVYIGSLSNQIGYYVIVLALSSVIGYMLRRWDTMPLIFAFILNDAIISNTYRFYLLNF